MNSRNPGNIRREIDPVIADPIKNPHFYGVSNIQLKYSLYLINIEATKIGDASRCQFRYCIYERCLRDSFILFSCLWTDVISKSQKNLFYWSCYQLFQVQ